MVLHPYCGIPGSCKKERGSTYVERSLRYIIHDIYVWYSTNCVKKNKNNILITHILKYKFIIYLSKYLEGKELCDMVGSDCLGDGVKRNIH